VGGGVGGGGRLLSVDLKRLRAARTLLKIMSVTSFREKGLNSSLLDELCGFVRNSIKLLGELLFSNWFLRNSILPPVEWEVRRLMSFSGKCCNRSR